jgi:hypothetical protein
LGSCPGDTDKEGLFSCDGKCYRGGVTEILGAYRWKVTVLQEVLQRRCYRNSRCLQVGSDGVTGGVTNKVLEQLAGLTGGRSQAVA